MLTVEKEGVVWLRISHKPLHSLELSVVSKPYWGFMCSTAYNVPFSRNLSGVLCLICKHDNILLFVLELS